MPFLQPFLKKYMYINGFVFYFLCRNTEGRARPAERRLQNTEEAAAEAAAARSREKQRSPRRVAVERRAEARVETQKSRVTNATTTATMMMTLEAVVARGSAHRQITGGAAHEAGAARVRVTNATAGNNAHQLRRRHHVKVIIAPAEGNTKVEEECRRRLPCHRV